MEKIKITIDSIKGECAAGCKVGDAFYYQDGCITVEDASVPLCAYAICAITPYLSGFWRSKEDDWMSSLSELQCPDPINAAVFRLEKA